MHLMIDVWTHDKITTNGFHLFEAFHISYANPGLLHVDNSDTFILVKHAKYLTSFKYIDVCQVTRLVVNTYSYMTLTHTILTDIIIH